MSRLMKCLHGCGQDLVPVPPSRHQEVSEFITELLSSQLDLTYQYGGVSLGYNTALGLGSQTPQELKPLDRSEGNFQL